MKTKFKILIGIACATGIAVGVASYLLFSSPFSIEKTQYVYIDSDDDVDSVSTKIETVAHPSTMLGFDLMRLVKRYKPRTGKYAIEPGASMYTLVRQLGNGIQVPVNVTIPTTRTIPQLIGRVSKQLMMDSLALANEVFNDKTLDLGYTQETLPCLFLPNTYEVYWDITPEKLVKRLQKERDNFWNDKRKAQAKETGMTPEEVTTLASIVESETNYSPEKARVAGLYINRLKKGIKLQSDPTVIFATGDFTIRRVLQSHLSTDSPYNTYLYMGLPPGPIRIPSVEGIEAVLNHEKNDYIYMCAKEDFSGSHNFATDYGTHMANARRYQQALNARGIKK